MKRRANKILALVLAMGIFVGMTVSVDAYSANSPFGNTGRNTYKHNDRFQGYLMVDGVDVSEYQSASTNWATAKKHNVDYAILRATWTGYSNSKHSYANVDSRLVALYENAKKSDIMIGIYGFSQATTVAEAETEAHFLVDTLHDKNIYPNDLVLPVYMDYEFAGPSSGSGMGRMYYAKDKLKTFNKTVATQCVNAYCDVIREAGYTPGLYANTNFFSNYINAGNIKSDVDLWCAQYYVENQSSVPYTKWQFTSSANICGVLRSNGSIGSTDANFWYIKKKPTSNDTANLASCTVYGETDFNYTGEPVRPHFDIYNTDGTLLALEEDYVIGYINNVEKGKNQAYAYIRGIGKYKGYLLIPFTIGTDFINNVGLLPVEGEGSKYIVGNYTEPQADEVVDVEMVEENATEEDAEPIAENPYPPTDYNFKISNRYIVVSQNNLKVGNVLAGLVPADDIFKIEVTDSKGIVQSNETEVKSGMMAVIKNKKDMIVSSANIAVENDSIKNRTGDNPSRPLLTMGLTGTYYYYDGGTKHPGVIVNYNGKNFANGNTSSTTNVSVSYSSGCKKPGTYYASATGKTCPGSASAAFSIAVKPTSIKSLSRGKKSFTVKVYKQASKYVTGYQVRYSKYPNMKSAKKKTIGTKYKTVKKKVKSLKKNKTYYVQVRSYKKISGKKYYSAWSPIRTVITK